MIPFPLTEFDSDKKDSKWFARVLLEFNGKKSFLISKKRYEKLKSYVDGDFDTRAFKKSYDLENQKERDLEIDFQPLDVLGHISEKISDAIDEEEIDITATCTDALSVSKEERDVDLLKVRKMMQPDLQKLSRGLGLKTPLKFPDKVKIKGQEQQTFSSDVSVIDKMKLDPTDEGDMAIFQDVYQRQHKEIAIEDSIEHFFKVSDVKELRKKFILDDIICNRLSGQNRMNHFSRQPDIRYLAPYEFYTLGGKRKDRKDSDGMGWETYITIRTLLQYVGDEVGVEDIQMLLNLANTASATQYNCVDGYEKYFDREKWGKDGTNKNSCSFSTFIEMRIAWGYLEYKSQNASAYELYQKYGMELQRKIIPAYFSEHDLTKKKIEHRYYDVTYKGYYIPGNYDRTFAFGKVPMQMRYGTQNQLTDFSLMCYIENGQSVAKRCKPILKQLNSLWFKFQYFLSKAMPSGELWDVDAVRDVAMAILNQEGKKMTPEEVIKFTESSVNALYKTKTIDGKPVGGDSMPIKPRLRGVDPSVPQLVSLMNSQIAMIREIIGSNANAEVEKTPPNTPERIAEITVDGQFTYTNFISSGIRKLLCNIASVTAWYVQQIIDSDDTEAIENITKAIGEDNVAVLKTMRGESPAKYSIFLSDNMTAVQKSQLHQLIDGMIVKGQIPAGIGLQIKEIKNRKTAQAVLGFQERRAMMQRQQEEKDKLGLQVQCQAQLSQLKINEIKAKSAGDLMKEQEITRRQIEIEKIKSGSKKDLKVTSGVQHIIQGEHKAQKQQEQTLLESKLNNQNGNEETPGQTDEQQPRSEQAPEQTPAQQSESAAV